MEYYKEKHFRNWSKFKEFAEHAKLEFIYRGQSDSKWGLQTSIERANIHENYPEFENEFFIDFKRGAKFYLSEEDQPQTMLEWFSLIQHFGAPSRLLDFTYSPYIAAYFAFETVTSDKSKVAIWVVNKNILYQRSLSFFTDLIFPRSNTNNTFDDATFERVFKVKDQRKVDCVFPVESSNINRRYSIQQSVFLCQGNVDIPFEDLVGFMDSETLKQTILKITIPSSYRKEALRDLVKMNIDRSTLFPSLDGFAKSLHNKYDIMHKIGELQKFHDYSSKNDLI